MSVESRCPAKQNASIYIKFSLLVLLCSAASFCFAQNLILNGNFEQKTSVGYKSWKIISKGNPQLQAADSVLNAYEGNYSPIIYGVGIGVADGRTFYTTKINAPLKKGQKYKFSCVMKLTPSSSHATRGISVAISDKPLDFIEGKIPNNPTQLLPLPLAMTNRYWKNGAIQSSADLMNWTTQNTINVDIEFFAKGNEQYLCIGNFSSTKETYIAHLFNYDESYNTYAAYQMDKVKLVLIK